MRVTVDEAREILKNKKLNAIIILTWNEEDNSCYVTTAGNNRHNADFAYEQSEKISEGMGYTEVKLLEDKRHEYTS